MEPVKVNEILPFFRKLLCNIAKERGETIKKGIN